MNAANGLDANSNVCQEDVKRERFPGRQSHAKCNEDAKEERAKQIPDRPFFYKKNVLNI